jgi:hypothetical protein
MLRPLTRQIRLHHIPCSNLEDDKSYNSLVHRGRYSGNLAIPATKLNQEKVHPEPSGAREKIEAFMIRLRSYKASPSIRLPVHEAMPFIITFLS